MTNPTPGPWTVNGTDHNDQPQVMSGHRLVAVCPHECLTSLEAEAFANAHLIAASYDLLEVLTQVMKLAENMRGLLEIQESCDGTKGQGPYDIPSGWFNKAYLAIEKATGETRNMGLPIAGFD